MKCLSVEFVTPDVSLEIKNVLSITSYTVDGEFMVLPGHENFIMELCSGVVKLTLDTKEIKVFYVLNPILKVTLYECKIIANQLINAYDVNIGMLKAYKEGIEKILHNINDKMLLEIAEKQLNFINNIKMHENIS
ncbi:ATP synthase epsilon chain 2 [Ehrlichia ruminantium]|uniref:ATP synthase epsilon chain 2 n=1 Tax=Ehrlichia ruminantium (strain Welgevonden) TaxID=254945 RepID=A0A0H3M190_EHRRW|nr:hypothetical protein [Ehrlichia ruminantium]QLK52384.1 hypothetical protein FDZ65_02585 [Ehrlichia ruminantium]QLK54214.1 hypothetical protein FDZ63_02580 [Ehrlichia ruminantium]QLK55135.1 hypothetical protein FDZ62_02595 [Ehrlichia ruminantium]QLK56052.1 hypothetical protein FDZ61_02590 [Ehrlichia ruminantium]QLK56966.1 hypothetical protein FDZ60_02590 [Ehrlichia ruminantium]